MNKLLATTVGDAEAANEPYLAYLKFGNFIFGTLGGSQDNDAQNEQYITIPAAAKFHHIDRTMYDVDPVGDPGNPHVVDFVTNYEIQKVSANLVRVSVTTHGPRFNFHPGIWVTNA